jgi:nucleoside-diphosphate-sugar epimerase
MDKIPLKPVLVTGGGGFLGKEVCRQLLARGYRVRSFSRGAYPGLEDWGVECRQGSLQDQSAVTSALEGCAGVFHCAGNVNIWGRWEDLYATNVKGTEHVLTGMRTHGIRSLVFTSSPSVVCTSHCLEGVDESQPYPLRYLSTYPATKALAEQKVMKANGKGVYTVSIRPHFIWGPGDPQLLPNLIRARKKNLLRSIGKRLNLVDAIYVENAAQAHIQAFETLERDPARVGGKTYFVGQESPVNLWEFIDRMFESVGVEPLRSTSLSIPLSLAYGFGYLCEKIYSALGIYDRLPPMTRFIASQMAYSGYFSHAQAERDFGYHPTVSIEEGLKRLRAAD